MVVMGVPFEVCSSVSPISLFRLRFIFLPVSLIQVRQFPQSQVSSSPYVRCLRPLLPGNVPPVMYGRTPDLGRSCGGRGSEVLFHQTLRLT